MKKTLITLITSISLLLSCGLHAQTDSTDTSLDYMFDDADIYDKKNVLKLNLVSILNGDFSIHYERVIKGVYSVEVGVGILREPTVADFWDLLEYGEGVQGVTGGYSLWLQPKWYVFHKAPRLYYGGLQLRRRVYKTESVDFNYNDIALISGLQFILKRITIDWDVWYGLRLTQYPTSQNPYDSPARQLIQTNLKLGYTF